ncbi:Methylated-DNA--protein-cysteine methyltransferase, inducible [Corynebacterium occultum]|uniref:methylated-DNA--[protein]-cysteine S-methyltransferase n=1 Tax=Corynebacterium occultum TaxID=2675219 RepID=A0A6B8W640_9CORY|nr:methylated-DNA--[protein]-cysteine S-methyltransferase [Corynebacterium occultum]QGU06775.1 Methylated-DNA--protein-cysteine methyltransferase, inducible [Corynebacterium occultum]
MKTTLRHRYLDSPIGTLLLIAGEQGLRYIAFPGEDTTHLDIGTGVTTDPLLDVAATQLGEYFAGSRRSFSLPLEHPGDAGFRHRAQEHLASIPYGQTRTYLQLARELDNPGAVRAVGSACATNPLPIVLPCHRVLRSDGGLGGYRGGVAAKQALLALEAA